MTEEEYFRKTYPDYCYGNRLLSPYWDLFQDGVEFGERYSEKKIAELEKENKELKKKYYKKAVKDYCEVEKQLAQAKEIIKEFVVWANWDGANCPNFKDIQSKAEQFIKEIKE